MSPSRLGLILLIAAFLLLPLVVRHKLLGDVGEYALVTIALANHGSPDIRPADIARARIEMPSMTHMLDALEEGRGTGRDVPLAGFHLDREGRTQAIHFFAYSALAVLPYKLLAAAGLPALKCFQFVNMGMLCVLLLAMRRFFGTLSRGVGALALYLACGGFHYLNWTSPETMSATALLAGLLLCASARPLIGGALIGLGATQNPTIVLALGLLPLIALCQRVPDGDVNRHPQRLTWDAMPWRPVLGGLAAGAAVFATGPLFNLHAFGVPSIIAVGYTDPALASWSRLHSLFFDLSQGMILAVPGVAALALALALRHTAARTRCRVLLAGALLVMLGMALPALVVTNWNSGASGVMRYAFWCAMPLLFVLYWQLREQPPRPWTLGLLVAVQLVAAIHGTRYGYTEFSPLARWVMRHAPALYNPEPEIFYERAFNAEVTILPSDVVAHRERDRVVKTMFNVHNEELDRRLCGIGRRMAAGNNVTTTAGGWRYLNGPAACVDAPGDEPLSYGAADFNPGGIMIAGWSRPQFDADPWSGTWSTGTTSRMQVMLPARVRPRKMTIVGMYHPEAGHRTRVMINGHDYGWLDLEHAFPLDLPPLTPGVPVTVDLWHQPAQPPAGATDQREFAWFLRTVAFQ